MDEPTYPTFSQGYKLRFLGRATNRNHFSMSQMFFFMCRDSKLMNPIPSEIPIDSFTLRSQNNGAIPIGAWDSGKITSWGALSILWKGATPNWCVVHHFNGHDSGTDWLEVPIPYILGLYISGLNFREYPRNSYGPKYGTVPTYLHVLDPESFYHWFPLKLCDLRMRL